MKERNYQAGTCSYRYSIYGQEVESELNKNIATALFWEYDSRIGRRWNLDPQLIITISPYVAFDLNPIYNSDHLGEGNVSTAEEAAFDVKHEIGVHVLVSQFQIDRGFLDGGIEGAKSASTAAGKLKGEEYSHGYAAIGNNKPYLQMGNA